MDTVTRQCDDITGPNRLLFCCFSVALIKGSFPAYPSRCVSVSQSVLIALWGDPA